MVYTLYTTSALSTHTLDTMMYERIYPGKKQNMLMTFTVYIA